MDMIMNQNIRKIAATHINIQSKYVYNNPTNETYTRRPMRTIIRQSVFETNSSSTHSLTLGQLTSEQEQPDYQAESIFVKPQHFGYGDIVAPNINTNNFPKMNELCGDCPHLKEKKEYGYWEYRCDNPAHESRWSYGEECQRYQDAQQVELDKLIEAQSPDTRASALFTCIVCRGSEKPELLRSYFDSLRVICKKVYYRDDPFSYANNTGEYWKQAIYHANLGKYESPCWMEEHGDLYDDFESIATDTTKLKQYLFGKGAYASGDRCG